MSIKVFYGDGRVEATEEVRRILGEGYEVIEGVELNSSDLPSLMMGATLFEEKRRILIRDLFLNRAASEDLVKFVATPHEVVLLEGKVDKRSAAYKELLKAGVEFREFKVKAEVDFSAVFEVYRLAKRDGAAAVRKLRELEPHEEPMMFFGLLVSQAMKDYATRQGVNEKRILRELSQVDMQMKTSSVEPWLLIEGLLLRLSQ